MKIGVLTWYFGYNYGARAHSYALMKMIEALGHECEFINYKPHGLMKTQLLSNLNFNNRKRHPLLVSRCMIRCLNFQKQLNLYHVSKRVRNAEEIADFDYDLIILGSDEILNILHPLFDKIYYSVGIENKLLALYAPSSGQTKQDTILDSDICGSLERCIGFSARDYHTKALIESNIEKKTKIVLDPTFLYDFADIYDKNWKERDYLLLYSFDPLEDYADRIVEYAHKENLKIYSVGRYSKVADKSLDMASFDRWVEVFRHARLVVTDSFHGTVFAIKNKKPFIVCSRSDKVNKINDLLKELLIDKKFYDKKDSFEDYLRESIDYEKVAVHIEQMKQESLNYLSKICSIAADSRK